jgi:hypothetical protein
MKEAADLLTRLESLPQAIRAPSQIPSDFTSFMACARYYSTRLRPALECPPVRGLPWAWLKVRCWLMSRGPAPVPGTAAVRRSPAVRAAYAGV